MKININDTVKVKLTPLGVDIYFHQYDEFIKEYPIAAKTLKPIMPKIDKDGYTEIQLWHLMELYGKHLHNGCNLPFETNIVLADSDSEK